MATGEAKTPLKRMRAIKNTDDVCSHMVRIYRQGRFGEIETEDMSRYANVLNQIADLLMKNDLEERVAKLEEMLEKQSNKPRQVA